MIVAIDPGTTKSGVVIWHDGHDPRGHVMGNEEILQCLRRRWPAGPEGLLAIEMVASYGMAVGREVFETVLWIGRFVEAWGGDFRLVYRREVKSRLCGVQTAKDSNIRAALLDMWPHTGGGATPAVGTKKQPGPLYGFKSHAWQALGVAVVAKEGLDGQV